jgi:hypothetical protein
LHAQQLDAVQVDLRNVAGAKRLRLISMILS